MVAKKELDFISSKHRYNFCLSYFYGTYDYRLGTAYRIWLAVILRTYTFFSWE